MTINANRKIISLTGPNCSFANINACRADVVAEGGYTPTVIVTNQAELNTELAKSAAQLEGQVIGVQYNATAYSIGTELNSKNFGTGLVICTYGGTRARFDAITLTGTVGLTLHDLAVQKANFTGGSALVLGPGTSAVTISGCDITADKYAKASSTPGSPYLAYGISGDTADNVTVTGCYIHDVHRCITLSACSTWTVRGNYLTPQAGSGIQYGGGCDTLIVERNHLTGQSWTTYPTDPDAPSDPHASMVSIRSNDITIRQNVFRNMGSSSGVMCYTPDAAGGEIAYSNITVENNAIYDVHNNYGIRIYNLGTNFVVRNNLVYSKYRGGADGRYLYETALIVHNLGTGITDHAGLKLYNNLLLGIVTVDKNTVTESKNIAWSLNEGSTFYSAWVSGTGSVLQSTYGTHSAALTDNTIFANPSDLTAYSSTVRDWSLEPSGLADEAGDSANQPSTSLGSIVSNYVQNNGLARSGSAKDIGPYQA